MQKIEEQVALLRKRAEEHTLLASHGTDARARQFNVWAADEYRSMARLLQEMPAEEPGAGGGL